METNKVLHTPVDIARWVINNRYPKSENDKVSDAEMLQKVKESIYDQQSSLLSEVQSLREVNKELVEALEYVLGYMSGDENILCQLAETMASMEENASDKIAKKLIQESIEIAINKAKGANS